MDSVVIVAGGKGKRMRLSVPKQFLELRGKPLLFHTLEAFHAFNEALRLIVVLPPSYMEHWQTMIKDKELPPHQVVKGGEERFHSVKNGLKEVPEDGIVGVHDGVRCLVSPELIERCFATARKVGNAVPVLPVNESLRWIREDGNNAPLDRDCVRMVQTPQCFRSSELKQAFDREYDPSFTDEATVMEAAGHSIHLVDGEPGNVKITTPEDLKGK